jgi:hypothetical protein
MARRGRNARFTALKSSRGVAARESSSVPLNELIQIKHRSALSASIRRRGRRDICKGRCDTMCADMMADVRVMCGIGRG